jgi:hypothetical protein
MNLIARIILGLVKLALVVGLTGGLIDLTQAMRDEAVKAHRQGIVSLKQLNSALVRQSK